MAHESVSQSDLAGQNARRAKFGWSSWSLANELRSVSSAGPVWTWGCATEKSPKLAGGCTHSQEVRKVSDGRRRPDSIICKQVVRE